MNLQPYVDAETGETIDCLDAGANHVERVIDTKLTGVRRCARCGYEDAAAEAAAAAPTHCGAGPIAAGDMRG